MNLVKPRKNVQYQVIDICLPTTVKWLHTCYLKRYNDVYFFTCNNYVVRRVYKYITSFIVFVVCHTSTLSVAGAYCQDR